MPGGRTLFKLVRPLLRMQISRYRRSAGDTAPKMMGFPVVLLTTTGAKTGLERTTMLGGFDDGDGSWLIVASNGGAPRHPAWFLNVARHPDKVWLEVGRRKFRARVESLRGEERVAALGRVAAVSPQFAKYQVNTDREIPVLRLAPAA